MYNCAPDGTKYIHYYYYYFRRRRKRRSKITLLPKILLFLIYMYSPVVIFKHKMGLLHFHVSDDSTFFITNDASGQVVKTECENQHIKYV